MKVAYGEFVITDEETTIQRVFELLQSEAPSAKGLEYNVVAQAIQYSLCASIYKGPNLVAFARVLTDYSTVSVILDVVVDPQFRKAGLGKALFNFFEHHPRLKGTAKILWTKGGESFFEYIGYKKMNRTLFIKSRK